MREYSAAPVACGHRSKGFLGFCAGSCAVTLAECQWPCAGVRRCEAPKQDPEVLPYLQQADRHSYDIRLEAAIQAEGGGGGTVTRSNFRHLCAPSCTTTAQHVAQQLRCL